MTRRGLPPLTMAMKELMADGIADGFFLFFPYFPHVPLLSPWQPVKNFTTERWMGWTVHRFARGLGNGMVMEMEMEMEGKS